MGGSGIGEGLWEEGREVAFGGGVILYMEL